ncbi:MAG: hypothetical protein ABMA13_12585 [Chthoniobacteraceae bacterium]
MKFLLLLVISAVCYSNGLAAPGDLDPFFGSAGVVKTSITTGIDRVRDVALQKDGAIVVAGETLTFPGGDFAVARYTSGGVLDPAFGVVTTDFAGGLDAGSSVAVQSDGKVIVAGHAETGTGDNFAVARYTSAGTLDLTFGVGGKVMTAVGTNSRALGVALQSDGKIVVAGWSEGGPDRDLALVRYHTDGTLDATFNSTGIVTANFFGADQAASVAVQDDGLIVVTGNASLQIVVARFTSVGGLDPGFGGGAGFMLRSIGTSAAARDLTLQRDGKILVSGQRVVPGSDFFVARYDNDGTVDSTFGGGGGFVATDLGSFDSADGVAVSADGRIFATGFTDNGSNFDIGLVRYTSGGVLDAGFGSGGIVITQPSGLDDQGGAVAVQSDGRVVVAGYSAATLSDYDFAVLRYQGLAAGDLDPLDAAVAGADVYAAVPQPDGKVIIAGEFTSVRGVTRNNIARLNADGTLDATFDPNVNGLVACLAVQEDGKVLLGGNFTTLQPNGAPSPIARSRVARVNADGTLDAAFDPKPDSGVTAIVVQPDGRVLLGGEFTTLQPNGATAPTARLGIARVNRDGTLDTLFDPRASNVTGIALQADGRIVFSGAFTSVQPNGAPTPTPRSYIARVNSDGALDSAFDPGANDVVLGMAVQADGRILLAGDFTTLQPNGAPSSTPRNFIARVNADGTLDTGFDPNAGARVASVAIQADARIVIGGSFLTLQPNGAASPTTRNHIARLNADGSLDPAFDPNADSRIFGVTLQGDGRMLLGGVFSLLQPNGAPLMPRTFFARVFNDPFGQTLAASDATQVRWTRSGAAPEVTHVTFEVSIDDGATWQLLGPGSRLGTTPDWQLTGITLPTTGLLRARGRAPGGFANGSSGLVEQVAKFGAITRTLLSTGDSTVAPDVPGRVQFAGFANPDLTTARGSIITAAGRRLNAVFGNDGAVLLRAEQVVPVDPAGGADVAAIARFRAPIGDAAVVTLKRENDVTAANDQVLFTGLMTGEPQAIVREGQAIPNAPDDQLGSFISVDGNGPVTFFLGTLKGRMAGGRLAVAVFAAGPPPVGFRMLVRKGQLVGTRTVRTVATLVGQARTLAEGRWRGGALSLGVRLTFTDGTQALYLIPATAVDPDDWLLIAQSGDDAAPALAGAKLRSFRLPAYAPDATVFDSLLRLGEGGITRRNNRAIFDAQGIAAGGPPTLRLLAQLAGPAPAQSNFQRFLNVLAGLGRASTVVSTNASRETVFDAGQDGQLRSIARRGENAPGGGRFDRFVSVAKPDGTGYGALVSALLRISGRDGVTARNRAALYAVDSSGNLRRILRAGDLVESAGPGSVRKSVRTFVALKPAPGSVGAARGYDAAGRVAALVQFPDRSQAVLSIQVP